MLVYLRPASPSLVDILISRRVGGRGQGGFPS
jgi:hypothetical protein